jgi:hypothetical protein
MPACDTIPNEEAEKKKLSEAMENIRRAESFPVQEGEFSHAEKPQAWARRIELHNYSLTP